MKKWIFITTCTVVVLLSTVNVYRVLGDWNTPFLSMLKLEQLAYGEGGNAGGEGGGSVNYCDIFIYNRGYMESWGFYEISSNIDAGAYITLPGGRRIRLGIDVRGGTTIRYPFCDFRQQFFSELLSEITCEWSYILFISIEYLKCFIC